MRGGDSARIERLLADVGDSVRAAIDEIVHERIGTLLSSLTGAAPARQKQVRRAPARSAPTQSKAASGRRCRLCRETGHRANKCPKRDDAEDE